MKRDTSKLCGESSLRSFKMNSLVLVVKFIMMNENICCGTTSARGNNPDKPANLNDSIQRKFMQLHSKFAQDIHKDWKQRDIEASSEEILEHHSFVFPRIQNRLCTRWSNISLWKIAGATFQKCKVGVRNGRLPKVIADTSQRIHNSNLHTFTIVRGSIAVARAIRPSTLL
jgi:hypothetical protein